MAQGKMLINESLLCEVMRLPPGTRIVSADMSNADEIVFVVEHPQIVQPTQQPAELRPMWSRHEPIQFDGWGQ